MSFLLLLALLPLMTLLQVPERPPIPLAAAVVVAEQPLVRTVGDTVVFSPDALNIEEDAMLEDVLKAIPGMEVDGGTVTLYGRKVEKLLLGGRLYFGGDILTGLRNLQGDAIESIRAYERPSEFTRLSGVDDGESEPVLDVKVKRKFMDAWKGRVQGGGTWPLRYLSSANAGMITDTSHVGVVASFRNTPSHSGITTTRLNRFGTGADGDRDRREAGVDFSRKRKDMDLDAHAKYTGYDAALRRQSFSETHYPASVSLGRVDAFSLNRSDALRSEAELSWRPSKRWTFLVKPYLSLSGTGTWGEPLSTTYSEEEVALNAVRQQTASFQRRAEGRLTFQATRRFDKKGRTASLRLYEALLGTTDHFFNDYRAETFKNGKTTFREQYIRTPSSRNDFQLQASWNEPFGKGFHLQLLLQARLMSHSIDRNFHSLEDLLPEGGWLCAGGTSVHGHPEGETRECSRTVRPRLTGKLLMLRDEGGGGVPLRRGRWQLSGGRRSQISASVHQSRNAAGRGTQKQAADHFDWSAACLALFPLYGNPFIFGLRRRGWSFRSRSIGPGT